MTEANPLAGGLLTIHRVITRGLGTSIQKCDEYLGKQGIPSGEAAGFTMYVSTLKAVTHSHHLSEDDIAFPYFRSHIDAPYDRLKDDHKKIASLLTTLSQYLPEMSSGGVANLRSVLSEIERIWLPHIRIEEENFTPEKVKEFLGTKEQMELTERLSRHGRANSGPGPLVLPFLFYNLEVSDRESFTRPFPWIVKKVLVPVIWKKQWKPMSQYLL